MPKYSYGPKVKDRVKRLLEDVLFYASGERDFDAELNIDFFWPSTKELIVRTTLADLQKLTDADSYANELSIGDIRTSLTHLRDFIEILEDLREHRRGSQDWHFRLNLWSNNINDNLNCFEVEWGQQREKKLDVKVAESGFIDTDEKPYLQTAKTTTPRIDKNGDKTEEFIYNNIPRSGIISFCGREQKLNQLKQALHEKDDRIVAIVGMAGVGKTELALHYSNQNLSQYPGGVCWIEAGNSNLTNIGEKIIEFSKPILKKENLDDFLSADFSILEKVRFCWANWPRGDVLVIFDDVQKYDSIKQYFPPQPSKFKVLITTRHQIGVSINKIKLDILSQVASLEILKKIISEERVENELQEAKEICRWLDYLPLGIELVGRYLHRKLDLSLANMLKRLEQRGIQQLSLNRPAAPDMTSRYGVMEAFEVSWQDLSPLAQKIGCLMSLFAPVQVSWQIVESCLPECDIEELEEARDYELKELSLIFQEGNKGLYQLHRLIRSFFRHKLESLDEVNELKSSFANTVTFLFDKNRDIAFEKHTLLPHLLEVVNRNLNYVDPHAISIPLNNLIFAYGEKRVYNLRINVGKIFENTILELLRVVSSIEKKDVQEILSVNLKRLFDQVFIQQYIYDTSDLNLISKELMKLFQLVEGLEGFSPESFVFVSKMLGHAFYADRLTSPEDAIKFLEIVAKISRTQISQLRTSGQMKWKWYLIFSLDHIHNLLSRQHLDKVVNTGYLSISPEKARLVEIEEEIDSILPDSLSSVNRSPNTCDYFLALRAAHYWGHRGNQITFLLYKLISQGKQNFNSNHYLNSIQMKGIDYYTKAIIFRFLVFGLSFPQRYPDFVPSFLSQESEFPKWFSKWSPRSFLNQASASSGVAFERFPSLVQSLGDIAHQYRGISTIYLWIYPQIKEREKAECTLKKAQLFYDIASSTWEKTIETLEEGYEETIPKYYSWMLNLKIILHLMLTHFTYRELPNLQEIRNSFKDEFKLISERFGWEYRFAEKSLQQIEDYYHVVQRNGRLRQSLP